ncbi:heavy metal translocating P-type ATPase [Sinomonas halotolerans]|uniref:Heavy metal translocating P-type ATPase n=1 Tax=Sinomonas halotolerans TaxID=1644133 RepID=A0ABU9X204_9MICC
MGGTLLALAAVALLLGSGQELAGRWAASAFALAVAVRLGARMARALGRGRWGIDILAVTAIVSTVLVGEYVAALIIVLMLAVGTALEDYAARRAKAELAALLERTPRTARRAVGDGYEDVPAADLRVGDVLLVRSGEVVPVDGMLLSDSGVFDESSLTGESLPVERSAGDEVMSGSVNGEAAVLLRSTAALEDSQYSRIVALVREASESRAPMVRLADRYAVPFTVLAYALGAVAWAVSGSPTRFAEVLVVATPCPLLIAAPVAFLGGTNRAAASGIMVKYAGVLELLGRIRTAVFDKTGTLTYGRPTLLGVLPEPGTDPTALLRLSASAEQYSSHVLAASIIAAAADRGLELAPGTGASEHATHGVRVDVAGRDVVVGKPSFVAAYASGVHEPVLAEGQLAVYVGVDGRFAGVLMLSDPLRREAPATLDRLRALGVEDLVMLTGDALPTAERIAAEAGLAEVRAECLPADKVEAVRSLPHRPVMMVGDGVNDAPVLAAADVGVAMGARGSTAAGESADVVILQDDLARAALAVAIGQRTVRVALQSIWIGIALSIALMAAAAWGYVPAVAGALSQEAVDLAAILNALRALRPGRGPGRWP